MADRDAAESPALILMLLLPKSWAPFAEVFFPVWNRTRIFRNNRFVCSAFRDQELMVEVWLLSQGCYFTRFLPEKFDKQGFAMFLIVISARAHLQVSTISFLPLIQSIPGVEKQHRFKSRPLRNYQRARRAGGCRWTRKNVQVRRGGVEPGGTTAVARGPERGLPRPGRGLCLPAATWHRTRAQGSIMQAWPWNPEQGRDSYILQQAPFSWQTWGKLMLLLCLSFWKRNGYT